MAVDHDALVIGGGMAGMTAALDLAEQGFEVHLVEKEGRLGGNLRNVHYLLGGTDPQKQLDRTMREVIAHPRVPLHLNSKPAEVKGFYGNFESKIEHLANGSKPTEHRARRRHRGDRALGRGSPPNTSIGADPGVLTQNELEMALATGDRRVENLRSVS